MATLESAEALFGKKPDVTPLLGIPKLTEDEKQRLTVEPDCGITPARGLHRFPSFEDWQESGGVVGKNNFVMHFKSSNMMMPLHEMKYMQRFMYLYPETYDKLENITDEWYESFSQITETEHFSEEQEHMYWEAYENMANLVSADDPFANNGKDLPPGEAYPALLFS